MILEGKDNQDSLILISGIMLLSLFVAVFLPALLTETFSIDYRFKHVFNGSDFAFYYNSALIRFNEIINSETVETLLGSKGVPEAFYVHKYPIFPIVDEAFYLFTLLPFREAYWAFIAICTVLMAITLRGYYTDKVSDKILFFGLILIAYPVIGSLEKGQIALLLLPLTLLFFRALQKEYYLVALVALGIVTHIKIFPIYMFLLFVVYLVSIKKYKEVIVGFVIAVIWIAGNYQEYMRMLEYFMQHNHDWALRGGIINHSIFSFSYFVQQVIGISIEVILKIAAVSGFVFIAYRVWIQKQISIHAWIFAVSFCSIMPDSSYFYNLIIFIAFIPILPKGDWKYALLIGLIIAYPAHLGLKGFVESTLLGLFSIKLPLLIMLMSLALWREHVQFNKEKSIAL